MVTNYQLFGGTCYLSLQGRSFNIHWCENFKIHKTFIIVKNQWKICNRPAVFVLKGQDLSRDGAFS
jgi:hypothetical protein